MGSYWQNSRFCYSDLILVYCLCSIFFVLLVPAGILPGSILFSHPSPHMLLCKIATLTPTTTPTTSEQVNFAYQI